MPSFALAPHPDFPAPADIAVSVTWSQPDPSMLVVDYRVDDPTSLILWPTRQSGRTDGLWQHSCFEAFIGSRTGTAYAEFNLSPSGAWAAYAFDDYRSGMHDLAMPSDPVIVSREPSLWRATLDLTGLAALLGERPWRLALTTVIEAKDGTRSFWSLRHPVGKPDFHHADCFAARLD